MFRIAKDLVHESAPAVIPLITVQIVEKTAVQPKTKPKPQKENKTPPSKEALFVDALLAAEPPRPGISNTMEDLPEPEAAVILGSVEEEASALLKSTEKKIVAKLKALEKEAAAKTKATDQEIAVKLKNAEKEAASLLKIAKKEASDLLKAAEEEAAAKLAATAAQNELELAEAKDKIGSLVNEARLQGHEEGFKAGCSEGSDTYRQQKAEAAHQLRSLLQELAEARQDYFDAFEEDMLELALKIAEKITLTAINIDDKVFKTMISNALNQLWREGKITLRVSEQQYRDYFDAESSHFVLDGESIRVSIINDVLLNNGDIILESTEKTIDASVSSQLKRIALSFSRLRSAER